MVAHVRQLCCNRAQGGATVCVSDYHGACRGVGMDQPLKVDAWSDRNVETGFVDRLVFNSLKETLNKGHKVINVAFTVRSSIRVGLPKPISCAQVIVIGEET